MERRTFCGVAGITALSGCTEAIGDFSDNQLGQSFATDDGLELTVDQIEAQSGGSVTLDEYRLSGGSDQITFILPHIVATNTTESPIAVPSSDSFVIQIEGVRRESYRTDYKDEIDTLGTSISDPVSGPLFPSVSEIGPDEEANGWLVFRTPDADSTVTLEARVDEDVFQWTLQI